MPNSTHTDAPASEGRGRELPKGVKVERENGRVYLGTFWDELELSPAEALALAAALVAAAKGEEPK